MFDFKLMNIHNNIKENEKEEFIRNIVSDADKLDSLGTEAIERMYYYQEHSITEEKYTNKWFENHITHIKTHCQEKLYILLSHNYIKTDTGKKIAIYLLKEMKEIVEDNDKLVDFIREL